ncbi:MAG: HEPN domain-containing protein [Nitrososphaerota archaeon]|nr:HEPN domain-containing protein [Candidatus Bathyarchaeota archaeon]MCX8161866.1 HEPN domain-containing protein [Candidatus Bathyarchaeota archaeon]MDW8062445.1 HEPN domain-containing protein [Nitrososphaerota archaeon]
MLDDSEYSRWISTARRAIDSAYGDLDRGDYNWACFKAQQAAEFAVKALLYGTGSPAYGHSITRLLTNVKSMGVSISDEIVEYAKTLDKYYVPTRYPNAWAEGMPHEYYTNLDATNAIMYSERIISWVEGIWIYLRRGEG